MSEVFRPQQGHIEYFGVEEWHTCARYRHACGVRGVHCDIGGVRAVVHDVRRRVHVYCPAADDVCTLTRTATGDVRYKAARQEANTDSEILLFYKTRNDFSIVTFCTKILSKFTVK